MSLSSPAFTRSQAVAARSDSGSLRLQSPGASTAVSTSPSTSTTTSPLKRKHSEISSELPIGPAIDRSEMSPRKLKGSALPYQLDLTSLPPFDPDSAPDPPSPAPTEIVDIEGPDFVRTSKEYGVKVRDFAYEDPRPGVSAAAEVWHNPFVTLLHHDMHIRRPYEPNYELSPKSLHRLLDIGLVTEEEAKRHWTPVDWQRLKVYRARPQGPYPYRVAMKRIRPSRNFRTACRLEYFGDPSPSDIPESEIYIPEDGPEVWEGDEATAEEMARMAKRRRLNGEDRGKISAKIATTATAPAAKPKSSSRPQPSSPPPSQSQPVEFSQVSNPIFSMSQDTKGDEDFQATPPTSPTALPEERLPNQSAPVSDTLSSAASPSSTGNSNKPRSRQLGRTRTFSVLLVR
ncbi:hypothetical protein BC629DRAFT_1590971 [Irpex lacteus]|nr:hypothetical protein BC629DRAFT_1590971 [Irpex lacteus]